MSQIVIGTAGHIDHGKTALVKALTGIDTDRLKEEKERGITIESGYAHLKLPGGRMVGLVDVPGHEKFIKNMLAGSAGVDLALLVIAADEGVMPQTREHLDILRLLEVRGLIGVITKTDLVEEDYQTLVEEEVQELLTATPYADASLVRVSARTGEGLRELLEVIDQAINRLQDFTRGGRTRLPIDRVFTIAGFGTVVTGTLFNGEISLGDILEVPTKGMKVRVRNIQVHQNQVEKAYAGQRVAVNLGGVEKSQIERGDVLAEADCLKPTNRLDLRFLYLPQLEKELKTWTRVRFHQGTREVLGRIILLDQELLLPGEEAFIQVILEEQVVVVRGDNYILRNYSPTVTIGGGRVVEPHAKRHKAGEKGLLQGLKIKAQGNTTERMEFDLANRSSPVQKEELFRELGEKEEVLRPVLEALVRQGKVTEIALGEQESVYLHPALLTRWEEKLTAEIKQHVAEYPLEPGLNKEVARTKFWPDMSIKDYNALLSYWAGAGKLSQVDGLYLAPAGHATQAGDALSRLIAKVEETYHARSWQVPDWSAVKQELALDNKTATQIIQYLIRQGKLVSLGGELYLTVELLNECKEKIEHWISEHGQITAAQARDLLGTTRKIVIPVLEYLDRQKFTVRNGDARRLYKVLV